MAIGLENNLREKVKILLIEQEQNFADRIQKKLIDQSYIVDMAMDWGTGWQLAELFQYDVILLGLASPDANGIKFCQKRRVLGDNTPIVMIGVPQDDRYKSLALESGATDYFLKPVAFEALLGRIRELIREKTHSNHSIIEWQGIKLNFQDCHASYKNHPLCLNQPELTLLALFLRNRDRIFSLSSLIEHLFWGFEERRLESSVVTYIEHLNQKLQQAGAVAGRIEAVYGLGYCLRTIPSTENANPAPLKAKLRKTLNTDTQEEHNPLFQFRSLSGLATLQTPRLLIVDHDVILTQLLTSEANTYGIEAEAVHNLTQARIAIALHRPDIVLLDLQLSEATENGLTLLAELTHTDPPIPVIVSTTEESFAERLKVAQMGGQGYLHKPLSPDLVMEAVTYLLQQTAPPVGKLMIVGADPPMLELFRDLLSPWGFQLIFLGNPQLFWDTLEQANPDLLILDFNLPNVSGIELCQVVRQDNRWNDLPILMLSAERDAHTVQKVFAVGADDFIHKPIVGPELIARILNRLERNQMRRRLADTDGLTGIANRRKAVQDIDRLLRIAKRQQKALCFALLDLDHFKYINDRYGHEIGDRVLKKLGKLLKQHFRGEDIVCRWGGEEFALCLFGIEKDQVIERLTAFLAIWDQQMFLSKHQEHFQTTFSAGIAQYPTDGKDLPSLYQAADSALYMAKEKGRNQVFSC